MANALIASLAFSVLGIVVLILGFIFIDRITPHDLWKEVIEKQNVALSILAGAFVIAIGLIISAAVHG